jgi:hypothetical protein
LIGYRTLRKAGDAKRLGFYGFGAAAHIAVQVARAEGRQVFAFTRAGDTKAQEFARRFGAIPGSPGRVSALTLPPGDTNVFAGPSMTEGNCASRRIWWCECTCSLSRIRNQLLLKHRHQHGCTPLAVRNATDPAPRWLVRGGLSPAAS